MKDPQRVEMRCALTLGLIRDLVKETEHMPDTAAVGVTMSSGIPVGIWAGQELAANKCCSGGPQWGHAWNCPKVP